MYLYNMFKTINSYKYKYNTIEFIHAFFLILFITLFSKTRNLVPII